MRIHSKDKRKLATLYGKENSIQENISNTPISSKVRAADKDYIRF